MEIELYGCTYCTICEVWTVPDIKPAPDSRYELGLCPDCGNCTNMTDDPDSDLAYQKAGLIEYEINNR